MEQFQGIVPDDVIEELVDKLQGQCFDWAPTSSPDDYDTDLYDAVRENSKAQKTLDEALTAIFSLLALNIAEPAASVHRRLLFANVIAALETFLSDTFINRVLADDILLQRYLDTEKTFQERKFPLKDALRVANDIKALATKELIEMVWHSMDKAALIRLLFPEPFGPANMVRTGTLTPGVWLTRGSPGSLFRGEDRQRNIPRTCGRQVVP